MESRLAPELLVGPHRILPDAVHCVAVTDGEGDDGLLKNVVFYALDSRQESILWDVKPAFVVVYDPDVTFVRQLEVRHTICCRGCLQANASSASAVLSTLPTCCPATLHLLY